MATSAAAKAKALITRAFAKAGPNRSDGFVVESLAVTYFRMREAHYHWRRIVSRPCSGWEGVVPIRYGRQT